MEQETYLAHTIDQVSDKPAYDAACKKVLADKQIQAQGRPQDVLTETLIQQWYKAEIKTLPHYATQTPQFQFCY